MKKILSKIVAVSEWKQSSRMVAIVMVVTVVLFTLLSIINVSESDLMDAASGEVRQLIEDEKDQSRKRLTITYNDLHVISFISFSTSGAQSIEESWLGFAGTVFHADEGAG
ncbi:MAG TPA: hypothetical protein PLJ76_10550, partial [Treponemataceae bacterium]|nr:hypothetical protein [Treponemataceae bacterium]